MQSPHPGRSLLLLRHAKAAEPSTTTADHERQLAPRGLSDAIAVGRLLARRHPLVDLVLVSTALRTRQTWDQAELGGARAGEVHYLPEIYGATRAELSELVRATADAVGTLLIVGHGPGLPDLAYQLAVEGGGQGAPREALTRLSQSFPTSGLAELRLDVPWADLTPAGVQLVAFDVARGRSEDS